MTTPPDPDVIQQRMADGFVPLLLELVPTSLLHILSEPLDGPIHYGVPLSVTALATLSPPAAHALLARPRLALAALEDALILAQQRLIDNGVASADASVKPLTHPRVHDLPTAGGVLAGGTTDTGAVLLDARHHPGPPPDPGTSTSTHTSVGHDQNPSTPTLGRTRSYHVHRLVTMTGTLVRAGAVQVMEERRLYECTVCRRQMTARANLELDAEVVPPRKCPTGSCTPGKIRALPNAGPFYADLQEVRLQSRPGEEGSVEGSCPTELSRSSVLRGGGGGGGNSTDAHEADAAASTGAGRTMTALLTADLVESCRPGDDVEVTGLVLRRWRSLKEGSTVDLDLVLYVTHVRVATERRGAVQVTTQEAAAFRAYWDGHQDAPLAARDALLRALCPQIHGLAVVKLATMLSLVGGVARGGGTRGGGGGGGGGDQGAKGRRSTTPGQLSMGTLHAAGWPKEDQICTGDRVSPGTKTTSRKEKRMLLSSRVRPTGRRRRRRRRRRLVSVERFTSFWWVTPARASPNFSAAPLASPRGRSQRRAGARRGRG